MNHISNNLKILLHTLLLSLTLTTTILASLGTHLEPELECNFQSTIMLINQITNFFNNCCSELEQDFIETFTTLGELKNTLTSCCAFAQNEFNGTFTALLDLKNTLTSCCAETTLDFQGTWTFLAAEFNGTFTALSEVTTSLTTCCSNIENNFQGTFTVVGSLSFICLSACSSIPISAPITISTPGSYCLSADGTGQIIINANDVTLDLNNHVLTGGGIGSGTGIIVNNGQNRVIKNGRIRNFDTAVLCNSTENTVITEIEIDSCLAVAVLLINSIATRCNSINISNNNIGFGVSTEGFINTDNIFKSVTISEAEQGFVLTNFFNGLLEDCQVIDCSSTLTNLGPLSGFTINSGNSNQFDNCSVINFTSFSSRGFAFNNASNIILRNCAVQNVTSSALLSEVIGFDCTTSSSVIQLFNCSLLGAQSFSACTGYSFDGQIISAFNCLAEECISMAANEGTGFLITGTNIALTNCQALTNSNNGFDSQASPAALIQFCQAEFNTNNGFITDASTTTGNCSAYKNNIGFNTPSNASIYRCFSTQNTTDYSATVPNTQNTNTQVNKAAPGLTGPFAGGNLFM